MTETLDVSDIDECAVNPASCPANSECVNVMGSFYCRCQAGFITRKRTNGRLNHVCRGGCISRTPGGTYLPLIYRTTTALVCVVTLFIRNTILVGLHLARLPRTLTFWNPIGWLTPNDVSISGSLGNPYFSTNQCRSLGICSTK